MRIHLSFLRSTAAFALACAAAGLAPAAQAQKLAPIVGDPVPYSVSLPEGWTTEEDEEMLYMYSDDEDFLIMTAAQDLVAGEEEPMGGMPEADARRFLTTMIMSSDSLLLQMLEMGLMSQGELKMRDVIKEIRTLGGERAAYMAGRVEMEGEEGWMQLHVTMKDGIMYILGFVGKASSAAEREPLMARIRESFVLAEQPGTRGGGN